MPQKTWAVGEEVLAADFNNYVQNQVVPAFSSATQRDAEWTSPPNGALCVLTDSNTMHQRVSGAWRKVYETGLAAGVSFTAGAATMPHTLGRTPTVALLLPAQNITLILAVNALNPTTLGVIGRNHDGTAFAGTCGLFYFVT